MELRETLYKCTCVEHDPYCCQIHGNCPVCVKPEEPEDVVLGYKTSLVAQTMDSMTNNKKQTAVDLFHNKVNELIIGKKTITSNDLGKIWLECKNIEHSIFFHWYFTGKNDKIENKSFRQRYNETYETNDGGEKMITGDNNNPGLTMDMVADMNTVTIATPSGQNNTGTYPEPKQIWKHYKGGRYEIIAMCNHTTTNEVMVVYKSLSFNGFHARPYSEWHDEVWVNNNCKTRFTLISW